MRTFFSAFSIEQMQKYKQKLLTLIFILHKTASTLGGSCGSGSRAGCFVIERSVVWSSGRMSKCPQARYWAQNHSQQLFHWCVCVRSGRRVSCGSWSCWAESRLWTLTMTAASCSPAPGTTWWRSSTCAPMLSDRRSGELVLRHTWKTWVQCQLSTSRCLFSHLDLCCLCVSLHLDVVSLMESKWACCVQTSDPVYFSAVNFKCNKCVCLCLCLCVCDQCSGLQVWSWLDQSHLQVSYLNLRLTDWTAAAVWCRTRRLLLVFQYIFRFHGLILNFSCTLTAVTDIQHFCKCSY